MKRSHSLGREFYQLKFFARNVPTGSQFHQEFLEPESFTQNTFCFLQNWENIVDCLILLQFSWFSGNVQISTRIFECLNAKTFHLVTQID